jgi:hypothetical protein
MEKFITFGSARSIFLCTSIAVIFIILSNLTLSSPLPVNVAHPEMARFMLSVFQAMIAGGAALTGIISAMHRKKYVTEN